MQVALIPFLRENSSWSPNYSDTYNQEWCKDFYYPPFNVIGAWQVWASDRPPELELPLLLHMLGHVRQLSGSRCGNTIFAALFNLPPLVDSLCCRVSSHGPAVAVAGYWQCPHLPFLPLPSCTVFLCFWLLYPVTECKDLKGNYENSLGYSLLVNPGNSTQWPGKPLPILCDGLVSTES